MIEQFLADGIFYMFGNPGTVEQGFLDAAQKYKEFHYITCLQESIAVAIADGYARKRKKPALIQLHSGVGLGNGIGMLYQAYRGHTPLIVITGEAGIQYDAMDAQMACDLVSMAQPVTKYARRVVHRDSLLRLVRRAIKMAMTPPMGPVFLSLPMDILEEENEEEVVPSLSIKTQSAPDEKLIHSIAKKLLKASHPILLLGDGVNESGAEKEAEKTAKLLGANVFGVNTSCINFSQKSPYYRGDLGHMFGENSTEKVKEADAALVLGTYLFPEVFPDLKSPFLKDASIIHIDQNTYEIGKNHPITCGIAADIHYFLHLLNEELKKERTKEQKKEAKKRRKEMKELAGDKFQEIRSTNTVTAEFFRELEKHRPENLILFDEALTTSSYLSAFLPCKKSGTFYQTRGGSLGVGIPGAIGIKMADPKAEVIGFTGDGGSMYTIQALYTAGRYQIGAKFVICDNRSYKLLEDNIDVYWKQEHIESHDYPECFSLEPAVDFVKLAESMGVKAISVTKKEEVQDGIKRMLEAKEPFLVVLRCF